MIRRFFNLFRRARLSRDVSQELDFHILERTDELAAGGMAPDDAAREARRQFGRYALHKEDAWMAHLTAWLETLGADLRYAGRGLRKSPGLAAVAILSLALGIGANTAIFSLINAVMLRSLPVRNPEELVKLKTGESRDVLSNPIWEQVRSESEVFSGSLAFGYDRLNTSSSGETRFVNVDYVSGGYFSTLGVGAHIGRTLAARDDQRGCPPAAVLSHSYWMKEYGGDPAILGRTVSLDRRGFPIVGVARAGFTGLDVGRSPDLFIPLCSEALMSGARSALDEPLASWLRIMGRRKPSITAAQMNARLEAISPGVFSATEPRGVEMSRDYLQSKLSADPAPNGVSAVRSNYGDQLFSLIGAAGLVLLIACANVANLLLARSAARQREMAVRLAMGAGRGRLIRQALTESLLLAGIGAALGALMAQWSSRLLVELVSTTGRVIVLDLSPDLRGLSFALAAGALTGVLAGAAPAWRSAGVAPIQAMKAQTRGISESFSRMRLGRALVVAQIALTLVLAAAAGLLLATFRNLAAMDPGFRAQGVLLVAADLRSGNLAKPARDALRQEILRRLRELPGVHSAAASLFTPISGMRWNSNIRVDRAEVRPGRESIVFFNALSPGYFETLGTALIAGRDFNDGDTAGSPKVAIVNETTAQKFFGKASPLGHRLRYRGPRGWSDAHEIVGLVRDAKYRSLREAVPPTAYFPLTQSEDFGGANFEVRIAGSPGSLVNAIKSVMADVNPGLNLTFLPLSTQIAESLTRERLLATLSGFFGALALLLAAIGLYGVLSYNVARRRNEIGIRMALGAARARVLTMILGEAGWLAGAGLGLGLAGTLAATHLVSAFLYGLNPNDPATLAAAVALLLAVAGIASYLPARRAAMLDPMVTLREE